MTALQPVWAGPLSPEALGELEAFHALSVDVVRRRRANPLPPLPESWAQREAWYREQYLGAPDFSNGQAARERKAATRPVPPVPARSTERLHGLDSRERSRLATIREAAGKARRA